LDKVVKKVIEIEHGTVKTYQGNYSQFVEKKAKDLEIAEKHYSNQQKEIARQQASIDLLLSFNREKSVRRARSKEKQLAKLERVETPKKAPSSMRLVLEPKTKSGNDILKVENVCKSFGDFVLFKNANIDIKKGETVALIGENGVGKTTLFKIILEGSQPLEGICAANTGTNVRAANAGTITLGTNVKIGYYDQTLTFDDTSKSIFNEISDAYPKLKNIEIRQTLAAFLFIGDDIFKPLSALSGGERGRVALAKLMLSDANFLLLDEPTNHLDLFSKEILESAINAYTGTILYISHDRYFINNTADKIIELTPDKTTLFLGDYDYYQEKRLALELTATNTQNIHENDPISQSKQDYLTQKQQQSEARKNKAKIAKLEEAIEAAERAIIKQDQILAKEEVAHCPTLASEACLQKIVMEEKLNQLLEEWEQLQATLVNEHS
jgi:ATP-binding cassette subfamily F protein 3